MNSTTLRQVALAATVAGALLIAGCCDEQEAKIAKLEEVNSTLDEELGKIKERIPNVNELVAELDKAQSKLDGVEERMAELKAREELAEKRLNTLKALLEKLKNVIEAGDLSVRIKRGKMVLELPSAVLFASGEAELSEKGQETLDKVAAVLKGIKGREFQVAGHTDNVPLSKDNPFQTNWHLSTARAVSVVLYLKQAGVRPKNLSAAGYAHLRPVASNKSAKGKARNRRIEIVLMPNLEELPDLTKLETEFGLKEPEVAY
jgi:chemotaxis protein MotB